MKVLKLLECIPNLTNMLSVQTQGEVLIESGFVENYFLKKYGEWYTINNSYNGFLSDFQYYNLNKVKDLKRMLETYFSKYNPLDNYNGKEEIIETFGKQTETLTDGQRIDVNIYGNEKRSVTEKITSYDSNAFSDRTKNEELADSRTDNLTKGTQTNKKEINEYINKTVTEKSGNLGVTTSQQMIESEIEMRLKVNVIENYLDNFIAEWCFLVD